MEDFLGRIRSVIPEQVVSLEWLAGVLVLIAVYALGYFCGVLPSLLKREGRKLREQSATLYEEILEKIFEYDELYNVYIREPDSSKRTLLGEQISSVKENVKQLEFRLAMLEQREPRHLPLRSLPVRELKIERETRDKF